MDELCGSYMDPVISCSHEIGNAVLHASSPVDPLDHAPIEINDDFDHSKGEIACHPSYPALLSAYIECRKLGAPPEIVSLLQEIELRSFAPVSRIIGSNPELDEFMESYSEILRRYKEEFANSINEAKAFFASIETQLTGLCKSASIDRSDDADRTSQDDLWCSEDELVKIHDDSGETHRDLDLKQTLLRKYSGYLESLRTEFFKTRKKGKLPKDARSALLDWWKSHCKWPYPTEEEKRKLSGLTGLDTKQVNNWFINQRKRHWKPSAEARVALMESGAPAVYGSLEGGACFETLGGGERDVVTLRYE